VNTPIVEVIAWNEKAGMSNIAPDNRSVIYCIMEEMVEFLGLPKEIQKKIAAEYTSHLMNEAKAYDCSPSEHEQIDALNDMRVFLIGFVQRKGYDPINSLSETMKEVNSRQGTFVPELGKWIKDKRPEAMALWYKADYSAYKFQTKDTIAICK
jgi:hypothetical protein